MKRFARYISAVVAACLLLQAAGSGGMAEAANPPHIVELLYSDDYQGYQAGDTICIDAAAGYHVTIQPDPQQPDNLTAMQRFGVTDTSGFSRANALDAAKTGSGLLVLEERMKFSAHSDRTFIQGMYMRAIDQNYGFQLWSGSQHDFYGVQMENDTWYKITCAIDLDTQTYTLYIQDAYGYCIKQIDQLSLPAEVDFSQGIYSFYERYQGTSDSGEALYTDDIMAYKADRAKLEEKLRAEHLQGEKQQRFYSDALSQRLSQALVFYVGCPYAYVDNSKWYLDMENPDVVPFVRNDRVFVPLRTIADALGLQTQWQQARNTAVLSDGTNQIELTTNHAAVVINGVSRPQDTAPCIVHDRMFVPLRAVSEAFEKQVFWDARGMVVISNTEQLFADGEALQNELYDARYFVKKPDDLSGEEHKLDAGEQAERQAAFLSRNTEAEIQKVAEEFFSMIDLSSAALSDIQGLLDTAQYTRALKVYRAYAFGVLREMDEDYWDWNFAYTADSNSANNKGVAPYADKLLFDIITNPSGQPLSLGEPGSVNWEYNTPAQPSDPMGYAGQSNYMWNYNLFDPLFYSFWGTGNFSYLQKWTAYMDDWCINETGFSDILPPKIPDQHNSNTVASTFLYQLRLLAHKLPADGAGFSEVTLARMLTKIIKEYPVVTVTYMRSDPENWTPGFYASVLSTGLQLDRLSFRCADFYIRAGLRRAEDYVVTQMHPDGTGTETVMGYMTEFLKYHPEVIRLVRKYRPDMVSESWYAEQQDSVENAANALIRLLVPEGRYPAGFRDILVDRATQVESLLAQKAPQVLEQPENQAIFAAVRGYGDASAIPYTSNAYPYSGFYSLKDGWTPGSQNGFLFCSPHAYQRATGDNTFVLNAFGQDMIVAGEVGAYDPLKTPVTVDGKNQNATRGYTFWGHRNAMEAAADVYGETRWSSTEAFDFAEGVYDGPYGDAITDTTHRRQVYFLKECGLWIVADRMSSKDQHSFTQTWRLPVTPVGHSGQNYTAFSPESVQFDPLQHSLVTRQENCANLSMYQFGNCELTSSTRTETVDASNAYKISDFLCMDTTFDGQGESVLLSVLYPRESLADDMASIQKLDTDDTGNVGFTAQLEDGSQISYIANVNGTGQLAAGNVSCRGEALLVVEHNGHTSGIVLGCDEWAVNGVAQQVQKPNFEFHFSENAVTEVLAIDTPLEPVSITPGVNVFYDTVALEMTSSASDVDIRYTLDGTQPTESSPLYTQPVILDETTVVKAVAFRRGNAAPYGYTYASPVSYAVYTKQELLQSLAPRQTEQGLEYQYYEGSWKEAFVGLDNCQPAASGKAAQLFDFSAKQTDGPYSFRYTGYIDIGQDGVYTFYAPEEYVRPDIMEGYELNLYIDGKQWYPSTRRHAFGTWSIALQEGLHQIEVTYTDYRAGTQEEFNRAVQEPVIWDGVLPDLEISGPNFVRQPIAAAMLLRDR